VVVVVGGEGVGIVVVMRVKRSMGLDGGSYTGSSSSSSNNNSR